MYSEKVLKGDVVIVNLGTRQGSEQCGVRPCVVVQNNLGNKYAPTVIVAPVTSQVKNRLPTHITIKKGECCFQKESTILLEQVITVDKSRILNKFSSLPDKQMMEIDRALQVSFGIA